MVEIIKKFGWIKSVLTALILLGTLYGGVYSFRVDISSETKSIVDEKINIHALEMEKSLEGRFDDLEMQQAIGDTKLDLLLRAQGIEPPQ